MCNSGTLGTDRSHLSLLLSTFILQMTRDLCKATILRYDACNRNPRAALEEQAAEQTVWGRAVKGRASARRKSLPDSSNDLSLLRLRAPGKAGLKPPCGT